MRIKCLGIMFLLASISSSVLYSQTYSALISDFVHSANKSDSTDSLKASFLNVLDDEWEEFTVSLENRKNRKPRPVMLPRAVGQFDRNEIVLKVSEVVDTLSGMWEIINTDSQYYAYESDSSQTIVLQFSFYGTNQVVSVPHRYGEFHPKGLSEKDVREFWKYLSECEYQGILSDCNKYRIAFGYNDWAVLKWVQALATSIFPQNINSEQEIFTVFILNQMGYRVKLARCDDDMVVLFSAMQQIYSRKFVIIDTYPYYLAEDIPSASNVYTYKGDYVKANRPLDLRVLKPLSFGDSKSIPVRRYSAIYEKSIDCSLPSSLIEFYSEYPQMDAKAYASSVPSSDFVNHIKGLIINESGLDKPAYINRILSYMHLDFKYMIDQDQFGYEKPFFFEENYVYPYNDCEDRSIMMSVLLRHMLGLKVVLIDYEDHMCVGVNIEEDIKGDHLVIGSDKYYVCDPTYIGATIGMSIPKYKQSRAKVWLLPEISRK